MKGRTPSRPSVAVAASIAAAGGILAALAWAGARGEGEGEARGEAPAAALRGCASPPSAAEIGDPGPDGVSVDDSWGPLGP